MRFGSTRAKNLFWGKNRERLGAVNNDKKKQKKKKKKKKKKSNNRNNTRLK